MFNEVKSVLSKSDTPIKTRLYHHGSWGGVVQAHFENVEEAICFVTFAVSGSDIIITSFGTNPHATVKAAELGGNAIDTTLEQEAHKLGVRQLFIIHKDDTTELVRTYQVQPFVMGFGVSKQPITYVN